jgi:tRNA pseudouridine38-40 synthase
LKNYTLFLEYLGTRYYGWQKQKYYKNYQVTIQHIVEKCLSKIANHKVKTVSCGRTDKGVHATTQIINFFTQAKRSFHTWKTAINILLPRDIRVLKVFEIGKEFSARFSSLQRRYNYLIYQNKINSAFFHRYHTWIPYKLNIMLMNTACKYLLGEKNYLSFCSSECSSVSKKRKVHHVFFTKYRNLIIFDIQANAFLHNMIRNIMGRLINVGLGNNRPRQIFNILTSQKKEKTGKIAPAQGLYFIGATYPKYFKTTLIHKLGSMLS